MSKRPIDTEQGMRILDAINELVRGNLTLDLRVD